MVNKNGAREPFPLMMTMSRSAAVAEEMLCVVTPRTVALSGTGRAAARLRVGRW